MQNLLIKNLANNRYIITALIFLSSILLFTTAQFNHEFVQFESRFGLFAQEMWRNGVSFFPTTYNRLYPDYPATQTVLTYLLSLIVGKITIITAILPTVVTSAATLALTYAIGSLRSRLWGFYSVLLLLFTYNFFGPARSITLDQFTTTATVACFYIIYSAQFFDKKQRIWLLPVFWFFGFVMRGPIGLIVPASVTAGYYLIERHWRQFFKISVSSILLLIFCSIGLLAAAWSQGGISFVHDVIRMEAIGRVINTEKHEHFSYLFIALKSYWVSFPLALLVFCCTFRQFFNINPTEDIKLLCHLFLWILIVMVGLSLTSTGKDRYILPMAPAAALAAAYIFAADNPGNFLLRLRRLLIQLSIALPFIGLSALIACKIFSHFKQLNLNIDYIFIGLLLTTICTFTLMLRRKNLTQQMEQLGLASCATATFIILYVGIIQPVDIQFNSAATFVNEFEKFYQPNQDIVFYNIGPDQEDIKFMVAINKPIQPKFIDTPQSLINYKPSALFIIKDKDFASLTPQTLNLLKVIFRQKLGHQRCVVFEKV
jgi:hypothetical protein